MSVADRWEVEMTPTGCDVRLNGRAVSYDEDDVEDAARLIRSRGGSSYVLIEPDGYRTTHRA